MITKNIEMATISKNIKPRKDIKSKNDSDFKKILNQSIYTKPQSTSQKNYENATTLENLSLNKEPKTPGSGDINEISGNVSGDKSQNYDNQEVLPDISSLINIIAGMQIQIKPEIQAVAVEDGPIGVIIIEPLLLDSYKNPNQEAKSQEKYQDNSAQVTQNNTQLTQKTFTNPNLNKANQSEQATDLNAASPQISQNQIPSSEEISLNQQEETQNQKASGKDLKSKDMEKKSVDKDQEVNRDFNITSRADKGESTKVIKVKVGDAQKLGSAELTKEIARSIDIKVNNSNSYELELDPQNLGKIKVSISFEQGKTNVLLTCTNPKTAGLLLENTSILAQIIQESNATAASVNVKDESGYLSQEKNQNNKQQEHQQRENPSSDENEEFVDQIKLGLWEIDNLKRKYQMPQIS